MAKALSDFGSAFRMWEAEHQKSVPPYRWPLIRLAMRVEAGGLSEQERKQLAYILRQLAGGKSLSQTFGVRPGRRVDLSLDELVYEMAIAILPTNQGGRGLTVEQAKVEQAQKRNKSYDAIEKAWKSARGKVLRRAVKRNAPMGYEIGPI
jgi:hypothetical protein